MQVRMKVKVWLVTGRTRGQKAKRAFLVTAGVLVGAAVMVYSVRYRGVEDGGVVLMAGLYAAPVVGAIAAVIASLFPPHKELIYAAPAAPGRTPESARSDPPGGFRNRR